MGLAFSPDRRWLCSVGDINDGFVHLWKVDSLGHAKLYASNKCTSVIRCLGWLGGSIVTLGTRFVKIWRESGIFPTKLKSRQDTIEASTPGLDSGPRLLVGRNCLLGPLADATFTYMCPVSDILAIVCSDDGKVCLLKEDGKSSTISLIISVSFCISCCAFDCETSQLWVGGTKGENYLYSLSRHTSPLAEAEHQLILNNTRQQTVYQSGFVASGILSGSLVTVAEDHAIEIRQAVFDDASTTSITVKTFPSHKGAILGVRVLGTSGDATRFLTWSEFGVVIIWC